MAARWLQTLAHLDKLPELWRCVRRIENWPALMVRFFDLPGATYPVEIRSHSGIKLTLQEFCDALMVWELFCRNEYQVPADARVILDIGANIGGFAVWAARSAPNAQIFSVEPFPSTFNRLIANLRAHGLESRVTCLQLALAADDQGRAMSASAMGSSGRSLLAPAHVTDEPVVSVAAITLAQLIERVLQASQIQRIDLLKMDIEGAEHEVLPGLDPRVLEPVMALQIEYHASGLRQPLFDSIARAGFACVHDARVAENLGTAHFVRPAIASEEQKPSRRLA